MRGECARYWKKKARIITVRNMTGKRPSAPPPQNRQRSSPSKRPLGAAVGASVGASPARVPTVVQHARGHRRLPRKNADDRHPVNDHRVRPSAPPPRERRRSSPTHAAVGVLGASACGRRRLPRESANGRPARTRPSAPPPQNRRRSLPSKRPSGAAVGASPV